MRPHNLVGSSSSGGGAERSWRACACLIFGNWSSAAGGLGRCRSGRVGLLFKENVVLFFYRLRLDFLYFSAAKYQ